MTRDPVTWTITALILVGTTGIFFQLARPFLARQKRTELEKAPPPPPPPEFRRPAEFGPLDIPRDQIERMRQAIVVDQLASRKESARERRRLAKRAASWAPGLYEQERVQHWLMHWQDNVHIRWSAGRRWATT